MYVYIKSVQQGDLMALIKHSKHELENLNPQKCYIPTRGVNVSANKIPQTVDVGTKKRILSMLDSQSQDCQ